MSVNHPNGTARGGAAVIIRSGLKYIDLQAYQEDWVQCAKVRILSPTGDITIAAVYCPPRHLFGDDLFHDLLDNLGAKFIAGGDINAKHIWWGSRLNNPKGSALYKCITKSEMDQHQLC